MLVDIPVKPTWFSSLLATGIAVVIIIFLSGTDGMDPRAAPAIPFIFLMILGYYRASSRWLVSAKKLTYFAATLVTFSTTFLIVVICFSVWTAATGWQLLSLEEVFLWSIGELMFFILLAPGSLAQMYFLIEEHGD